MYSMSSHISTINSGFCYCTRQYTELFYPLCSWKEYMNCSDLHICKSMDN